MQNRFWWKISSLQFEVTVQDVWIGAYWKHDQVCFAYLDLLSSHVASLCDRPLRAEGRGLVTRAPLFTSWFVLTGLSCDLKHIQEKKKMDRPTIVCLCGSTRFYKAFQEANLRETLSTHELAELLSNFVLILRRLPDVPFSQFGQALHTSGDLAATIRRDPGVAHGDLPGWLGQE